MILPQFLTYKTNRNFISLRNITEILRQEKYEINQRETPYNRKCYHSHYRLVIKILQKIGSYSPILVAVKIIENDGKLFNCKLYGFKSKHI